MKFDFTKKNTYCLGHQKLYYHRVGTDQKDDVKVVEFPDHPKWMIGAEVSDCGTYVIITTHQGIIRFSCLFT